MSSEIQKLDIKEPKNTLISNVTGTEIPNFIFIKRSINKTN